MRLCSLGSLRARLAVILLRVVEQGLRHRLLDPLERVPLIHSKFDQYLNHVKVEPCVLWGQTAWSFSAHVDRSSFTVESNL